MEQWKERRSRLRAGDVKQEDVMRQLAALAFGRVNDCVRLVLEEGVDVGKLDLKLLSEVRRSEKGAVEVRLVDRLKALEQLGKLAGKEKPEMSQLISALKEQV